MAYPRQKPFQRKHVSQRDVLDVCVDFLVSGSPNCIERLKVKYPEAPETVLYSAMEREVTRGLIEYGTSIRGSWLTEEGWKVYHEKGIV